MSQHEKSQSFPVPALTISFHFFLPEPALTISFPANRFPNKLAPKVPYNMLKNPHFCSFVSFLIVLVTPFNKILESSRAWTIFITSFLHFIMSFMSFFHYVILCQFEFLHQSLKKLLLLLKELKKILLSELLLSLMDLLIMMLVNNDPKNPPDWVILEIWVSESSKSVDILLLNAFLSFVFCLVVNNNSWGRSFLSSIFRLILKVVSV